MLQMMTKLIQASLDPQQANAPLIPRHPLIPVAPPMLALQPTTHIPPQPLIPAVPPILAPKPAPSLALPEQSIISAAPPRLALPSAAPTFASSAKGIKNSLPRPLKKSQDRFPPLTRTNAQDAVVFAPGWTDPDPSEDNWSYPELKEEEPLPEAIDPNTDPSITPPSSTPEEEGTVYQAKH